MKRPTKRQISSRQKKLVRYQISTGKSDREIAKEFGVTTPQLRKFKQPAANVRRSYTRSKATQSLYSGVGPVSGAGSTKVHGVRLPAPAYTGKQKRVYFQRQLPYTERDAIFRSELVIQSYSDYSGAAQEEYDAKVRWAEWTDDHGLPTSWTQIREMHDRGEIDDDLYEDAYNELLDAYKEQ